MSNNQHRFEWQRIDNGKGKNYPISMHNYIVPLQVPMHHCYDNEADKFSSKYTPQPVSKQKTRLVLLVIGQSALSLLH